MNPIKLTQQESDELSSDYSVQDELSAVKLGFAIGLSEIGITPSEFETMAKIADGIGAGILSGVEALAGATTMGIGAGAAIGGYSGYLRHRAEKAIEGKNDPELVALRDKIRAYNELKKDLVRTSAVAA